MTEPLNPKVSLEEIGEAGSFEALRDQIIEDQLKKRYVKDLLGLLKTLGVPLVDEENGDRHVQIIELVLRRNEHVHNRGEVDERYLEADPQSKNPKYNLYNLKLGDTIQFLSPGIENRSYQVKNIFSKEGLPIDSGRNENIVMIPSEPGVRVNDLVRRPINT